MEPIDFHLKMHIEWCYYIAVSGLGFCGNFESGEKNIFPHPWQERSVNASTANGARVSTSWLNEA